MLSRRTFLGSAAGLALAPVIHAAEPAKKKLAVVTNIWNYRSHAWHMAERFLHGYPIGGKWHHPPFEVVSAYVDQKPEGDLSAARAKEFGFTIYPTVEDALRCGGKKLAVDAVLVIGEHGTYPKTEFGQIQYPRYQYFKKITDVYKADGKTAPVFNDKHLSWKFAWAKEMVDLSKEMKFGFCAGSSLPVTWRMPAIDLPFGAEVEEAMCVSNGGLDVYDFHNLEAIQCMVERRKGGETGVVAVQSFKGDDVWKHVSQGDWGKELFGACLSRSQTLAQAPTLSHRYPTWDQMKDWVKDPVAYRVEYADGLKTTMLLLNGLVQDFTFAAQIKGETKPLSTLFHLPPNPNVTYSAALMSKAEETFLTNKSPTPIERTLLTSGITEAGLQSLTKGKRLVTPHLAVKYHVGKDSTFARE
ncbi:MAG: hypothetical protein U0791_25830 [Gemmataceae bacterium]